MLLSGRFRLRGTGDNDVRRECMENNHIRIGWDGYGPIISDETDWSIYNGEASRYWMLTSIR